MYELNYNLLQQLVKDQRACVQLVDVDVTRLGDDDSEIRTGEDVALVATGKLRVHRDAIAKLEGSVSERFHDELKKCVDLVTIAASGDLVSPLPMDENGVAKFIHEYFRFHFHIDGSGSEVFHSIGGASGSLAWVKTVNTADIDRDQFVVSVKVEDLTPAPPPPSPPPSHLKTLACGHAYAPLGDAKLSLQLELKGSFDSVDDLTNRTFLIPLQADGENAHDSVQLWVKVLEVDTGSAHEKPDPADEIKAPDRAIDIEAHEQRLIVARVNEPSGSRKQRNR